MTIGDQIRYIRTLKGYSQDDMAYLLNISSTAYGDLEPGKTDVSHSRLEQIAKVLEISLLDLLSFGEQIANYFANSSNNQVVDGNSNFYSDQKDLVHELEKLKLENEKLKAEKGKAELEAQYWREKSGPNK